jgi:CRISPR/Cas system-associated exonuclease Cas4 (RecB family)
MGSIHISDVLNYKRCRRAWNWSSMHRENLTPLVQYAPFAFGTVVHAALAEYFISHALGEPLGITEAIELMPEFATLSIDDQELCKAVLAHYDLWQSKDKSQFADRNLETVATEKAFEVKLRNPSGKLSNTYKLAGRFDGLVRNTVDGKLYLHEIKTTRSVKERTQQLSNEEQCNAYLMAANQLFDEPVAGVIYTLIRKKAPVAPNVLKDGTLSVNKVIDTSAEYYLECIDKVGNDPTEFLHRDTAWVKAQYGEILSSLLFENKFFARIVVRRSQAELQRTNDELYAIAQEMLSKRTAIYAHGGVHCSYCQFKEPCNAMNTGNDYQTILQDAYRANDYHLPREGE